MNRELAKTELKFMMMDLNAGNLTVNGLAMRMDNVFCAILADTPEDKTRMTNPGGTRTPTYGGDVDPVCKHEWVRMSEEVINCDKCGVSMDDDDWIDWRGGECPVSDGMPTRIRLRNGGEAEDATPEAWIWTHDAEIHGADIVAYRVVEPAKPDGDPGITSPFTSDNNPTPPAPDLVVEALEYYDRVLEGGACGKTLAAAVIELSWARLIPWLSASDSRIDRMVETHNLASTVMKEKANDPD